MADGPVSSNTKLLILVARHESAFDELITGLLDVGITGATVVDSKGLGAILRQDMPMFVGMAALLPQHTGSKVILSLTSDDAIARLRKYLEEMHPDNQPIGIVLSIADVFGPVRL